MANLEEKKDLVDKDMELDEEKENVEQLRTDQVVKTIFPEKSHT